MAEVDWDDLASLRAALASPQGQVTAQHVSVLAPTGVRSMVFELEEIAAAS